MLRTSGGLLARFGRNLALAPDASARPAMLSRINPVAAQFVRHARKAKAAAATTTAVSDDPRAKALTVAIEHLERSFGKGVVMRMGDKCGRVRARGRVAPRTAVDCCCPRRRVIPRPKLDVDVISTGSLAIDLALGIGGLPRGCAARRARAAAPVLRDAAGH